MGKRPKDTPPPIKTKKQNKNKTKKTPKQKQNFKKKEELKQISSNMTKAFYSN